MRWTESLIPTLRDQPKEAEAGSHKWLLRGGFVRQLASGVYSYLPLGQKVLLKISNLIREEMTAAGASEVLLPALHPAELWKKTGRYETLGGDKISFSSRSGQEYVLGPTHEEVITELVAGSVKSYQNLPVILFQIQTKFRDELRPRFGIIRTKEFIMKDAYSFDRDETGLDRSYQKMSKAYENIFKRAGIRYQVVAADPGMMGGKVSQEFMVASPYGEDRVVQCGKCRTLASLDIAGRAKPKEISTKPSSKKPEPFKTPDLKTIEEIAAHFGIPSDKLVKTLIYLGDDKPIAAVLGGKSELNEGKLRRLAKVQTLRMAAPQEIEKITGAPLGFSGPVGLKAEIFVDWEVCGKSDFVVGANRKDCHLKGVNFDRDFKAAAVGDLRFAQEGDLCPACGETLKIITTMEIGHIFKLGTRYSEPLEAFFIDESGRRKPAVMGCYGIGVNRTMAAIVEENQDERGIKWPVEVAPFAVHLITVNAADDFTRQFCEKIYEELKQAGIETLYDDRNERAGVKFNDADLLGIPYQIIFGERNLKVGVVDVKSRRDGNSQLVKLEEVTRHLLKLLNSR